MSTHVPAQPGWWQRNWKWCVPVLGALLLAMFVALALGGVALLLGAIKSSGAYQQALTRAQSDPAVIAALGEPIRAGWFVQGNISTSGASGEADLAIPLDGPRADGTLYVVAEKRAGEWRYETLAVNVDGGERIVLEDHAATASP
ncbi:cytochrome c oxidase assembly factor 1 family protein [Pseudoxanthomonas sp. LH2527]|uniref:cytochrome c oxidase assembly factor Coa1 family protein n=1 Tax=Pseudoxanthomonas sp. LH2527 TaxID=2923249 RepID=UPI001F1440ED|nr:cytochrome c oxidase assembly factor Coa1 family protein [Pseudoxanthomonas sp. LH2527]MCH6485092.1 cytochrome c oxidase assembly factor 1 family protein [Pseudoxanthomonas sp. LH2527]